MLPFVVGQTLIASYSMEPIVDNNITSYLVINKKVRKNS